MSSGVEGDHTIARGSAPAPTPSVLSRTSSEMASEDIERLILAIELGDDTIFRSTLNKALASTGRMVLTAPCMKSCHFHRTLFMAAAARGILSIFVILLNKFDEHFKGNMAQTVMRQQLDMKDMGGMTVLMHAAKSGNISVVGVLLGKIELSQATFALTDKDFTASKTVLMHAASSGNAPVFEEIFRAFRLSLNGQTEAATVAHITKRSGDDRTILMYAARSGEAMMLRAVMNACKSVCDPHTVRHIIYQRDTEGMNLLMHACAFDIPQTTSSTYTGPGHLDALNVRDGGSQPATSQPSGLVHNNTNASPNHVEGNLDRETSSDESRNVLAEVELLPRDPAVPVFKVATALVKDSLWKRQIREQLRATDLWGRSILTHAVLSGRVQLFDAALKALRDDVLDADVEEMLDTEEDEREDTPMRSAIQKAGKPMYVVFHNRRRQLKKDVKERSKLSTIGAKIQSFIPGKLVVIFQLLLAEITGQDQLYLLIVMAALAPLFNAAGSLVMKEKPVSSSTTNLPKKSTISFLLGAPAMFFWGIGTSDVGKQSLGWEATTSATALAVATICIPAVDSFFNSKRVVHWWERWSCQEGLFANREYRKWKGQMKRRNVEEEDAPEFCFEYITRQNLPQTIHDRTPAAREQIKGGSQAVAPVPSSQTEISRDEEGKMALA